MILSHDFEFLQGFFKKHSGYQLIKGKEYLLESCLKDTMGRHQISSLPILVKFLKDKNQIALERDIIQAMTINETMFFRDKTPFEQLESNILPALVKNAANNKVSIWCTASSSGQEPYSVAMTIMEQRHKYPGITFNILATDISEEMVSRGRNGVYSDIEIQRGLSEKLRDQYFTKQGATWSAHAELRKMITFTQMNLLHIPAHIGAFDLILCRNVLIYFDAPQKTEVLNNLRKTSRHPGYLLVGAAEVLAGLCGGYRIHPEWRGVYQSRDLTSDK
jgi:chemotaxis protein methyltransferase CheR